MAPNRTPEGGEKALARYKILSRLSANGFVLLLVFLVNQFQLDHLNGLLLDGMWRTQWKSDPHPDIVLVAYDDESSIRYNGTPRIPAREISDVLKRIQPDGPKSIAILGPIHERAYSEEELSIISDALLHQKNIFVGYTDDESLGKPAPSKFISKVEYLPGFVSRDTFSYGADSVTRRVMVTIEGLPTLYARLAQQLNGLPSFSDFKNLERHGRSGQSLHTYIRWQGRAGTYPNISSRRVVAGELSPGFFKGKIVLFGASLYRRSDTDFILTPFSRERYGTSTLEGAAHSLVTLLKGDGLWKLPFWINWLLCLGIGFLTVNCVLSLSPGKGMLFAVVEISLILAAGWLMLYFFQCWADLAHPLIVAGVSYYLVIPYRLINEYRKRWHYQEKSELFAQLEQLKSNFLSLLSHDLKTPVARIQGNAELLLQDTGGAVSDKHKKYLEAIVAGTDDLSQYVETILDLTRIENARVPLQKTTKDINDTIQGVIESRKAMAEEKGITIRAELEPIFSFKFDVRLIHRVLLNLLENAIRYSPENTVITISSKEESSWVHVTVADEGFGIATDEQPKIFDKFYRCQNELTRKTTGTGLGLYLVRYFVELHQGLVQLTSDTGKGSQFMVSLPVGA